MGKTHTLQHLLVKHINKHTTFNISSLTKETLHKITLTLKKERSSTTEKRLKTLSSLEKETSSLSSEKLERSITALSKLI